MAVRNKQELIDRAAVLFPTEGDPLIQASELRSFIMDMVDSLAFMSEVTGAMVVQLINTQLGQTDGRTRPWAAPGSRWRRRSRLSRST